MKEFGAKDEADLHKHVKRSNVEADMLDDLVLDWLLEHMVLIDVTKTRVS